MSTKEVKLEECEVLRVQLASAQLGQIRAQLALAEEVQRNLLRELGLKYGGTIQNINPATFAAEIAEPESGDNSAHLATS